MLFQTRFHEGIRKGAITQTFRTWKSPRVVVGNRYRLTPDETVEVITCESFEVARITALQARKAGFDDRDELLKLLRKTSRAASVYRVRFRYVREVDPRLAKREDTSAGAVDEILSKLEAMDRRSKRGPWTRHVLEWIRDHPQTVSNVLAEELGRERQAVKADVRKLKTMGLTISHEVGYELSARGKAVLKRWKA